VTEPVASEGETVAVNVTLWPVVGVVVEGTKLVAVEVRLAALTVTVTALEELVA
jgi:hypothetical protein